MLSLTSTSPRDRTSAQKKRPLKHIYLSVFFLYQEKSFNLSRQQKVRIVLTAGKIRTRLLKKTTEGEQSQHGISFRSNALSDRWNRENSWPACLPACRACLPAHPGVSTAAASVLAALTFPLFAYFKVQFISWLNSKTELTTRILK